MSTKTWAILIAIYMGLLLIAIWSEGENFIYTLNGSIPNNNSGTQFGEFLTSTQTPTLVDATGINILDQAIGVSIATVQYATNFLPSIFNLITLNFAIFDIHIILTIFKWVIASVLFGAFGIRITWLFMQFMIALASGAGGLLRRGPF